MALLWCDGFDHYGDDESAMLDGAWAEISGGIALSSVNPRTGGWALRLSNTSASKNARHVLGGSFTAAGFGCAYFLSSLPSANGRLYFVQFRDDDNGPQITIAPTTTGRLRVTRGDAGGTIIAETAAPAVTAGAYNHVECRVVIDNANGEVEIRVNGVTVLNVTDLDTDQTGAGDVQQIAIGKDTEGTAGSTLDCDDVFAWDTSGSANTDFLGPLGVFFSPPNQDTAQADWAPTGSATGWGAIDEVPPDGDTSYIAAAMAGDVSEFDLVGLPAGISEVAAVVMLGYLRKTDAGSGNVQMSLVSSAVGSPPAPAAANGADRPITEVYTYWQDVIELDPATGAPWTASAVNDVKLRLERTA